MAAFNFDPDLPISAQPFYSPKLLCGHCKEIEASLVCPKCQCVSFCSRECMETMEHEDFCSRLAQEMMDYKNGLAALNLSEESTAQQVIEQVRNIEQEEDFMWEPISDMCCAKDKIVRTCMNYFWICRQAKLLEVALDQILNGWAYYVEFRPPCHDSPVILMLALKVVILCGGLAHFNFSQGIPLVKFHGFSTFHAWLAQETP